MPAAILYERNDNWSAAATLSPRVRDVARGLGKINWTYGLTAPPTIRFGDVAVATRIISRPKEGLGGQPVAAWTYTSPVAIDTATRRGLEVGAIFGIADDASDIKVRSARNEVLKNLVRTVAMVTKSLGTAPHRAWGDPDGDIRPYVRIERGTSLWSVHDRRRPVRELTRFSLSETGAVLSCFVPTQSIPADLLRGRVLSEFALASDVVLLDLASPSSAGLRESLSWTENADQIAQAQEIAERASLDGVRWVLRASPSVRHSLLGLQHGDYVENVRSRRLNSVLQSDNPTSLDVLETQLGERE